MVKNLITLPSSTLLAEVAVLSGNSLKKQFDLCVDTTEILTGKLR